MNWLIDLLQLLIGVLLVILLAYVTTRVVSSKAAGLTAGKYMNILDKIMLGNNKWLYIIQVGKEYFVIGVTANKIECIGTLADSDMIPIRAESMPGFTSIFDTYVNKFKGIQDHSINNEERPQVLMTLSQKVSRQLESLKHNKAGLRVNKPEDDSNEFKD